MKAWGGGVKEEEKEDPTSTAALPIMGVHSAQLAEAMSAFMKEGELSATGDAGY